MKILFMGTPDFAVPCMRALIDAGFEVCGAVTQPDKPKGRGHRLMPPPVKVCAEENNIPVFQPETLKDKALLSVLEELEPDLIAVVAYGKLLPEYVLNFPKYGCVNVHGSLLPKYRGAAPIQRCVIDGEKVTGVTTMYMEKGLDTGDMIYKSETEIKPDETCGELHDRLSKMGAELLVKTIRSIEDGSAPREKQDDDKACYAAMISKETGHIDWNRSAEEILNLIRGTNPWPISYTIYNEETLKIYRARLGGDCFGEPGCFRIRGKKLEISCGSGCIEAAEIQLKGGKRMTAESFLNGHRLDENIVLK